jgi:hypothetical protein
MRRSVTLLAAASVFVSTTLFGATPLAAAPIVYTVDTALVGSAGIIDHVTGSITTDGTIGALQPASITSWALRETVFTVFSEPFFVIDFASDSGGTLSWTPSALSATATDIFFNFQRMGGFFTASLGFQGPTVPPAIYARLPGVPSKQLMCC